MLQEVDESAECLPAAHKCTEPWVQAPAQHKTRPAVVLSLERWGQEGQKLKVILSYLANVRTAWATCEELGFKVKLGVEMGEKGRE